MVMMIRLSVTHVVMCNNCLLSGQGREKLSYIRNLNDDLLIPSFFPLILKIRIVI